MTAINSNIAATMANSLSTLKLSGAQKAFQSAARPVEEIERELMHGVAEDRKFLDGKAIAGLSTDSINEMKEISLSLGETLSDEDIQYALQYGRSVIADYSV